MIRFACQLPRRAFRLDVAFEAGEGVTALFGPSGCGKTTVLRLLAGLERAESGRIEIDGMVVLDTAKGVFVPPHRRRMGFVFQDAQLLPHLSVRSNLCYGRWFMPRRERRIDLDQVVEVLGIGHLMERSPRTLSGGERQRVAIGRALLASPRLLLMDEPLASLDNARRLDILPYIERLRDEFGLPIIYVSHAAGEVARLARRVVLIEAGRVAAMGNPSEILALTRTTQGEDRFDALSILSGTLDRYVPGYGLSIVRHPAGEILVPGHLEKTSHPVRVAIRATNVAIALGRPEDISIRTALRGRISGIETDGGPLAIITLALPGGDVLKAFATRLAVDDLGIGPGSEVQALIKSVSIDERSVPGLHVAQGEGG